MEQQNNYKNSIEITGNIASMSEVKEKSNGKNFMYMNIAQNSRDGRASFYPIYLDGNILENVLKEDLQVGNKITVVGKLDSYQKDGKQTLQNRPFEIQKIEKQIVQENTRVISSNSKEMDM